MTIKVWDYLEEYKDERDEILSAVDRVFQSGTLILGDSVRNFESEFSDYCGAKYGIGVDNATNAIFLALKSLNIGEGDEVITVSNTAVPTVSAIVQAGATPRFIDIEASTGLMDVSLLKDTITDKTRCIIPVHLFGQSVDMTNLLNITQKLGLQVIEDCSQAHGASHFDKKVGSMGDMGVFSFYPTKTLGGYGDGGMITTNNSSLNDRLRSLRFYGMKGTYYAEETGYNSRLDEVHAEILRTKLKRLDGYIERRCLLARRYNEFLSNSPLELLEENTGNQNVYYVYVVKHPDRDNIIAKLKERDIIVNISYPDPIHTMRGYAYLGGKEGDLPVTEKMAEQIFSLPIYPLFKEKDQDIVCESLSKILDFKI